MNWKAAFLFFGSSHFGFCPRKSSSAMREDPPQIYHLIPRAATRLAKEANRPRMACFVLEPHPVFLSRGKGVKQGRDNADNALVIAAVSVTTTRAAADASPLCMQPLLMVRYVSFWELHRLQQHCRKRSVMATSSVMDRLSRYLKQWQTTWNEDKTQSINYIIKYRPMLS